MPKACPSSSSSENGRTSRTPKAQRRSWWRCSSATRAPPKRCCAGAPIRFRRSAWPNSGVTWPWRTCSSATSAAESTAAGRIPGLGWYALAAAIFLAGAALAAVLVWRFVANLDEGSRFIAPGSAQVSIAHPGEYLIWHEYRTIYEGRSFDVPAAMPGGVRYRVEAPDRRPLEVQPYRGMSSEDSQAKSVSAARFEAPLAGTYTVAVEGAFEPRVIAVGPNRLWPILKLMGFAVALLAVSIGGAIAVALYGF